MPLEVERVRSAFRLARDPLPEVPRQTLLEFALKELNPRERAALNFSYHDPLSWQRLQRKYYERKPEKLKPAAQ